MITQLSTISTPGRRYGSFAGKETSLVIDIDGIVTLESATPKFKLSTATAKMTTDSSTPKHTVS